MLVHNALGETLKVTLSCANGTLASQAVKLESFPAIVVFPEFEGAEDGPLNEHAFSEVSFTSFEGLEASLTFRTKNPQHVLNAYRKA